VKTIRILAAGAALLAGLTLVSVTTGSPADCAPSSLPTIMAESRPDRLEPGSRADSLQRIGFASGQIGLELGDFASKLTHQTCW
jgi:hypothetical protein